MHAVAPPTYSEAETEIDCGTGTDRATETGRVQPLPRGQWNAFGTKRGCSKIKSEEIAIVAHSACAKPPDL